MKLNLRAFALTTGVLWGVGLFSLTWWLLWLEGPTPNPSLLTRIYPGYTITPTGSIIGLAWGFVDALIAELYLRGSIIPCAHKNFSR